MQSFDLIQMHQVVNHPELVIVVHGSIQRFHCLSPNTALRNSTSYVIFSSHKVIILGLNFVDYIWGVNILFISGPVDWL